MIYLAVQVVLGLAVLVGACFFALRRFRDTQNAWESKRAVSLEKERTLRQSEQAIRQEHESLEADLTQLAGFYELTKQLLSTLDRLEAARDLADALTGVFPKATFRLSYLAPDVAPPALRYTLQLESDGVHETAPHDSDRWLMQRLLENPVVWSAWPLVGVADTVAWDPPDDLKTATAFPLISDNKLHGFLVVSDLMPEYIERCGILVSQFALAIRRIRLYERVQELAIRDGLTGLLVRRHFIARLQEEAARAARQELSLAFLMVDIDHFKEINDRYGHLVGDAVLRELSALLRTQVRDVDLLGRYGGEEFGLALPETDRTQATMAAERIRLAVEAAQFRVYDEQLSVTVSIGVSAFPKDAVDAAELIEHADAAMYQAKTQGRNRVSVFGS